MISNSNNSFRPSLCFASSHNLCLQIFFLLHSHTPIHSFSFYSDQSSSTLISNQERGSRFLQFQIQLKWFQFLGIFSGAIFAAPKLFIPFSISRIHTQRHFSLKPWKRTSLQGISSGSFIINVNKETQSINSHCFLEKGIRRIYILNGKYEYFRNCDEFLLPYLSHK